MARFYTNENIPAQVATELRRLGHFDPDFCGQAERISAAVLANPEMTNKVVRVNRPG